MDAASGYGRVEDASFPTVPLEATGEDVAELAEKCTSPIIDCSKEEHITVHVMGEMTLTYAIVKRLREAGIECVASTTERVVNDLGDGKQESTFRFVQFRSYE